MTTKWDVYEEVTNDEKRDNNSQRQRIMSRNDERQWMTTKTDY